MSRRLDEFRHRTSVFEGAYRAWSHLGSLDRYVLEKKSVKQLDPISYHITNDTEQSSLSLESSKYSYEPLPRSGLAHPFVKAIIYAWLGFNDENDTLKVGLQTLRIWWQHRKKGENKTAKKNLHTVKMQEVINTYTRYFFELAHCLVVDNNAQPPRSLYTKLNSKKKVTKSSQQGKSTVVSRNSLALQNEKMDITPAADGRGMCFPGNVDLPGMVDAVKQKATQLAHNGGMTKGVAQAITPTPMEDHGNPNTTPIIFQNASDGDLSIVLDFGEIACAHCVKILETVLKGCKGDQSSISGLLDAAADKEYSSVLIKIDNVSNAKRIAFEAARNLSLVGYNARPKEIQLPTNVYRDDMNNIFLKLAKKYPTNYIVWDSPCTCPDHGVFRNDCDRHAQMCEEMFDAFTLQQQRIIEFVYPKQGSSVTSDTVGWDASQVNTYQSISPEGMQQLESAKHRMSFIELPLEIEQQMNLDGALDFEGSDTNIEPIPLEDSRYF